MPPRTTQTPATDIQVDTRSIKDPAAATAIKNLCDSLTEAFRDYSPIGSPTTVLVQSPNGSVYQVSVSNTGMISATLLKT